MFVMLCSILIGHNGFGATVSEKNTSSFKVDKFQWLLSIYRHFRSQGALVGSYEDFEKRVLELNPTIKDPDLIIEGQNLTLPNLGLTKIIQIPSRSISSDEISDLVKQEINRITHEEKRQKQIFLSPKVGYTRLDVLESGSASTAELLSELNYGFRFEYRGVLNSRWDLFFELTRHGYEIDGLRTLVNSEDVFHALGLTYNSQISSRDRLQLGLAWEQNPFVTAATTSEITIRPVGQALVFFKYRYSLPLRSNLNVGALVGADYMISGSSNLLNIDPTVLGEIGVFSQFKIGKINYDFSASYVQGNFNTSVTDQDLREISILFSAGFKY